ncbi:MAG: hypothetical protein JNL94_03845 [Planctomycetes bacterium]|nr:hypothetical protein [Planctomycetota bacterium]
MRVRGLRGIVIGLLLATGACSSSEDKREGIDLFPLYRDVSDGTSGERSVLFPLSNAEWDDELQVSRSWIFPFYVRWHGGTEEEGLFVPMLPLYMHRRSPDMETTQYVPVWGRTTEGGVERTNVLLFLFEWAREQRSGELEASSVFPLYQWEKGGAGQRFSLLRAGEMFMTGPIVSLLDVDTRVPSFRANADEPGLKIDVLHAVGKLVQLFHWGDAGSYTETRLLTIFASEPLSLFHRKVPHDGAPGALERRTVFFPFYWDTDDGVERTWRLWPFYATTESSTGSNWSIVSGAFGMAHEGEKRTLKLFWIPIELGGSAAPESTTSSP